MTTILRRALLGAALLCVQLGALAAGPAAPLADHHQHLFSPGIEALLASPEGGPKGIQARDLIAYLDAAGIERATVLSVAYMYGSPKRQIDNEYAKVKAENDWTAAQAAKYPQRLRAICGVNPLKDYALKELARCAAHPQLKYGVKLHIGNSDIRLESADHLLRLQQFFRVANDHRMAIVVHMRASMSKQRPYGAAQARLFLDFLLPLVPDVPVQIAHLAGTGPGYDDSKADEAMAFLAAAVEAKDPRTRNLWFDIASVVDKAISPANADKVVRRIRQVGASRILYGSDAATGDNLRPAEAWATFRTLPLTEEEFALIAGNVAPYLK
jgi:predicted TIM-barrel fold metal-dependent hydrolase